MATTVQPQHVFWEEKISIEPDLGDQRRSTYKALPSPPKTPKRVMMKYRFSGVFALILSLGAFVFSLVVALAGQSKGMFETQYLVALNTSRLGQGMVTFEKASVTSNAPIASASASATSNPYDPLDLVSSDGPLNDLSDSLGEIASSMRDAVNDGLGEAIDGVVESVVNQTGIHDMYYVYLQKICWGTMVAGGGSEAKGVRIDKCCSYKEAGDSISSLGMRVHSSMVIGQTRVSIPLLAKLASSLDSILEAVDGVRKAIFGFIVITLVGSILSAVSVLPAIFFPRSRLLVYLNMFWPGLATVFGLLAAILLSAVIAMASILDGFSDTVGVQISVGGVPLLFAWLSFVCVSLVTLYWASVWFVESREWSFVRRRRDEDEIGRWRGIGNEVWRDVKGRRRTPSMRADM